MNTSTHTPPSQLHQREGAEVVPEATRSCPEKLPDNAGSSCIERKPGHPQHSDRAQHECYERRQLNVDSENSRETQTTPTYERCS